MCASLRILFSYPYVVSLPAESQTQVRFIMNMNKCLKIACLLAVGVLAFNTAGFSQRAEQSGMCRITEGSIRAASKIRKLKIRRKVPCLVYSREQIKKHLLSTIDQKLPPNKLEFEGEVFRALGFVPDDYNYSKKIIEIYLSQIGGYYDPDENNFVMAGWNPEAMQTTVAVHELTHALQDQYYDLNKFVDMQKYDSDQLLARSALIEGDATAVMTDYGRSLLGQPALREAAGVESLMAQNVLGASMIAAGHNAPQSLIAMMIFPYTSGLRFVHHVLRRGGYQALDDIFRNPPRSTEEILHPEKYFSRKKDFVELSEKQLMSGLDLPGAKVIYSDSLGEFSVSALLSNYISDGVRNAEAAAGWGGDRVVLIDDQKGKHRWVIWRIKWDRKQDAEQFKTAYLEALQLQYPKHKFSSDSSWIVIRGIKQIKVVEDGLFVSVNVKYGIR